MLKTLGLTLLLVAGSVILLCVRIIIKGKFPNMHVSGNKAMQRRGIYCVQAQDHEARNKKELMK